MSDLEIIFLGTSGSVPTMDRSLPCVAVRRRDELIIFDCGEGTQRQMIMAKVGFKRKMRIFITHIHGDHIFGLPGLIQTMSLMDREGTLKIYGQEGVLAYIRAMQDTADLHASFPIEVYEVKKAGLIYEEEEYEVRACPNNHSVPGFAYALIEKPRPGQFHPEKALALGVPEGPLWSILQKGRTVKLKGGKTVYPHMVMDPPRPGRKIVYTGDTRPTVDIVKLAMGADVLIHESTFDDELKERAERDGHSTPGGAAEVAFKAGVGRLILTHISARYRDTELLLRQARKVFAATYVAHDLMKIEVPIKDAG